MDPLERRIKLRARRATDNSPTCRRGSSDSGFNGQDGHIPNLRHIWVLIERRMVSLNRGSIVQTYFVISLRLTGIFISGCVRLCFWSLSI